MDNRKWEADAIASPPSAPASPSDGYPTNGNPLAAQNATEPGEWWFHAVGEELRAVIVEGGLTPNISSLTQLRDAIKNISARPGEVIDFSGPSAPAGYLACPLSATNISRTTYAALFAAIGTQWGVGDGATTFGMPWYPADYASVQANANVGTNHVGEVIAHTHPQNANTAIAQAGAYTLQTGGSNWTYGGTTQSTGGASNRAAGVRVLKCVKY